MMQKVGGAQGILEPVCDTIKRCPDCCKVYTIDLKKGRRSQHKCGWGECQYCEKEVKLDEDLCYIQRINEEDDDPKLKKIALSEVGCRPYMVDEEDDDYVCVERDPPLQVFCDYEATTDEEGNQSPILLCLKTDECDQTEFFYGADYTESMLNYLESLAVDEDGDDRRVIVIFHNLKGYDVMFLLQHCYDTHREVTDQITVGTKIFSLTSDRLTFKDSLCFLPFPLSSFPATFGIEELCKGFFPSQIQHSRESRL